MFGKKASISLNAIRILGPFRVLVLLLDGKWSKMLPHSLELFLLERLLHSFLTVIPSHIGHSLQLRLALVISFHHYSFAIPRHVHCIFPLHTIASFHRNPSFPNIYLHICCMVLGLLRNMSI